MHRCQHLFEGQTRCCSRNSSANPTLELFLSIMTHLTDKFEGIQAISIDNGSSILWALCAFPLVVPSVFLHRNDGRSNIFQVKLNPLGHTAAKDAVKGETMANEIQMAALVCVPLAAERMAAFPAPCEAVASPHCTVMPTLRWLSQRWRVRHIVVNSTSASSYPQSHQRAVVAATSVIPLSEGETL